MVTRIEPRVPLVNDVEDDLADATHYDTTSVCTMDVVEEHRFRPPSSYADTLSPPLVRPSSSSNSSGAAGATTALQSVPRPRSPSIYSMFVTDHSHSRASSAKKLRCKNPSVYSMPIAAFRSRGASDDMDDLARDDGSSGDENSSLSDGYFDDGDDHRVFMTQRSRNVSDRNADTHSHMNLRPKCKNPSVYSMPILGASRKEVGPASSSQMRTLQVAPLVPLPFAEESSSHQGDDRSGHGDPGRTVLPDDVGPANGAYVAGPGRPRLKRVASRRVQPTSVRNTIATGFTSCRGRPNDEQLPPSYHVTVCVGILGVVFFFGGLALAIVGFNSQPMNADGEGSGDESKAMRVLGPVLLCLGFFMCLGCFVYLCVVYTRYKRLSAYLKRRNSARSQPSQQSTTTTPRAPHQNGTAQGTASDSNRVHRFHHTPEAAAEDLRRMLHTLQAGGDIEPAQPNMLPGDTPL